MKVFFPKWGNSNVIDSMKTPHNEIRAIEFAKAFKKLFKRLDQAELTIKELKELLSREPATKPIKLPMWREDIGGNY